MPLNVHQAAAGWPFGAGMPHATRRSTNPTYRSLSRRLTSIAEPHVARCAAITTNRRGAIRDCSRDIHVGGSCDPVAVELTATALDRIPRENLRVPRDEFVAVWQLAERMAHGDWYAVGVATTCAWIACASVPSIIPAHHGRPEPASSPLTGTRFRAHPELIEREASTADLRLARNPNHIDHRPGWLEAVAATLDWAWRGSGHPPLDVREVNTG